MTDAAEQPVARVGFWRRFGAFLIDLCLIGAFATGVGLFLSAQTDGYVRMGSGIIQSRDCRQEKITGDFVVPAHFHLVPPEGFKPTVAVICTKSLFGRVFDRTLTAVETTRSGAVTYTRNVSYPVDANGAPATAYFYIDGFDYVLLAVYLLLLEWRFGVTLGLRVVGARVQTAAGGPITLVQAIKRLAIRMAPLLLLLVFAVLPMLAGAPIVVGSAYFWTVIVVAIAAILALAINFIVKTRRRSPPWHDRIAGTDLGARRIVRQA